MSTARYRISTKEVIKISLSNQAFPVDAYWGMLTDPTLTDGSNAVDANGDLRILGISKFAVTGTNTVRNSTQGEIDTYAAGQAADEAAQAVTAVGELFEDNVLWRKAFKAVVKLTVAQLNVLRGKVVGVATSVWDAPNMANGTGSTSPGITVTGAAFGDTVSVAASGTFQGLVAFGYVSASNTVVIRLHNGTGGAINPGSLTYTVVVRRDTALADITNAAGYTALRNEVSAND